MRMKRLTTIALALMTSGCSLIPQVDGNSPDSEQVLKQHDAILGAITFYIGKLQEKGILPKPDELKDEDSKGDNKDQ